MGELKRKAIKGVIWSGIDKGGVKILSFVIGIIIARILSPADYGVVGMIMVFIALSNIIIDSGFSQALVQKKDRSDIDLSTAFYFNIFIAVLCYIILFLAAPYIADFYELPKLSLILRVIGINVVINSLATVQRANLLINLNFKNIALVNISGVTISAFVGIMMAYNGFGVWALVFQQISSYLTSTIVYWIVGKWRPKLIFSVESLHKLWSFGSKLLAAGLLATSMREIYSVTIGKFYRPAELGYYSRAVQTSEMVAMTTNELINAVTFPILSKLQDDLSKLVSVFSRMLGMTVFVICPIMTMLAITANPLVSVLLTDKWLPVVPLLQWLCFARMLTPINSLNMNIFNAVGRSDIFLKLDLVKLPLTVLTMIITIPIGVKAIVVGNLIWTILCYLINAYLPGKMYGFGIKSQLKVFVKPILATGLMAITGLLCMSIVTEPMSQLVIGIISSILAYLFYAYLLNIPELKEIKDILNELLKR